MNSNNPLSLDLTKYSNVLAAKKVYDALRAANESSAAKVVVKTAANVAKDVETIVVATAAMCHNTSSGTICVLSSAIDDSNERVILAAHADELTDEMIARSGDDDMAVSIGFVLSTRMTLSQLRDVLSVLGGIEQDATTGNGFKTILMRDDRDGRSKNSGGES